MPRDDDPSARAGAALAASLGLAAAAAAVPLGLPPAVPFGATLAALLPVLAGATGRTAALARVGGFAARAPRAVLAVAVVAVVVDRHLFVSSAGVAPDDMLAAAVVAAAVLLPPRPRSTALLVGLALATYAVAGAILVAAKPYHSDAVVAAHGGAEVLLAGGRPYSDFDMLRELHRFGLSDAYATPLEDGTRLRALQYPALAFLVPAPLVAAGLSDVRALYLVEVLAVFALVAGAAPRGWRTVALAACLGDLAVLDQAVLAGTDPLWALLVLGAWMARRHRASAVLVGLAVATRQPAWLVAPFLVVAAWRDGGIREAAARSAIALGVALAVHLPFLATSGAAVLADVAAPALLPLEPWGVGPAKLAADGLLPLLPRSFYLGAAAAAYLGALWAFATGRARGAPGALALPLLPLWLSWRALLSYFAPLAPFVMVDGAVADPALGPDRLAVEPALPGADGPGVYG